MSVGEQKFPVGRAGLFRTWLPSPAEADPTLVLKLASGDVSLSMTPAHAGVAVTAISGDRTTLTLGVSIAGTGRGLIGEMGGQAWLDAGAGAQVPVTIASVDATGLQLTLAAPLPRTVRLPASGGTLEWTLYTASLSAAQMGTLQRNVEWTITWDSQDGADAPTMPGQLSGVLHIVRRVFKTGLTHQQLQQHLPQFTRRPPVGFGSWAAVIEVAHDDLVERVRAAIQEMHGEERWEDDTPGTRFRRAHGYLTVLAALTDQMASGVDVDARDLDKFDAMATNSIKKALKSLWVDTNGDGLAQPGEAKDNSYVSVVAGTFCDPEFDEGGAFDRVSVTDER